MINTGEKPDGGMWRIPKEKPTCVLVYILMDGIDEALEKVVRLGGKVFVPKSKGNGTAMATFADPDGNLLGLYENTRNDKTVDSTSKFEVETAICLCSGRPG